MQCVIERDLANLAFQDEKEIVLQKAHESALLDLTYQYFEAEIGSEEFHKIDEFIAIDTESLNEVSVITLKIARTKDISLLQIYQEQLEKIYWNAAAFLAEKELKGKSFDNESYYEDYH